uniref:Ig-like domain-containing protein n=1 Tax=Terrapene triunguis TaxID=2587831 RepID=A0A674I994_9SAUR
MAQHWEASDGRPPTARQTARWGPAGTGCVSCANGARLGLSRLLISVPRRLAIRNTETYFPCHVWGFYPQDVTVTWLRDGRVLTDATCSAPQRNPDGTFNLTAIYMFTPTASDSGSIFSCRVSHAALAQPLGVPWDRR